jgi:hypothetical protein
MLVIILEAQAKEVQGRLAISNPKFSPCQKYCGGQDLPHTLFASASNSILDTG